MTAHEPASPEQIEHDIAATRAEMNRTLDSIQRRFSGVRLVESLLGLTKGAARGAGGVAAGAARGARDVGGGLRDTGGAFAGNLGHTIRQNPVPVALLGLGVGWLALASRRGNGRFGNGSEHETASAAGTGGYTGRMTDSGGGSAGSEAISRIGAGVPARSGRVGEATSEVGSRDRKGAASGAEHTPGSAERARERVQSAAGSAAGRISEAGRRASERVSDAGGKAKESLASAGEGARDYAARARETTRDYAAATRDFTVDAGRTVAHTAREHPLLVAAGLFVAGAAVAAALPRTRREDEWMGDRADEAKQAAKDVAGEAVSEVRRAAGAVADATKRTAEREGMTADEAGRAASGIAGSAGRVIDSAGSAAREEVDKRLAPETRQGEGKKTDSPL